MSTDPTRTKTVLESFESDLYSRFRAIKGDVRESIEKENILRLGATESENESPDPKAYKFLSRPEKREQFQEWIQEQVSAGVLENVDRDAVRRGDHYTGSYVRAGYAKGVQNAGVSLRKQGLDADQEDIANIFNKPIHSSKIEMLYLRSYDNLEGITQAMDTQISRELSKALSQGWNPRKAASEINDRVDKIGITRARTLSRTEVIHAHSEGTLDRLEREGVEEVTADVEFSNAGDHRVCSICRSLQGNTYKIKEARGLIPVHPRCRCAWLPITNG